MTEDEWWTAYCLMFGKQALNDPWQPGERVFFVQVADDLGYEQEARVARRAVHEDSAVLSGRLREMFYRWKVRAETKEV